MFFGQGISFSSPGALFHDGNEILTAPSFPFSKREFGVSRKHQWTDFTKRNRTACLSQRKNTKLIPSHNKIFKEKKHIPGMGTSLRKLNNNSVINRVILLRGQRRQKTQILHKTRKKNFTKVLQRQERENYQRINSEISKKTDPRAIIYVYYGPNLAQLQNFNLLFMCA